MAPSTALPLEDEWNGDVDNYINSLLSFATTNKLFIQLCGGVHILDFLTREPDLYTDLLPQEWRDFFDLHDVQILLQLLLREDLSKFSPAPDLPTSEALKWQNGPFPPSSLVDYIRSVRRLSLRRNFRCQDTQQKRDFPLKDEKKNREGSLLPHLLAQGMNVKKVHEVENFSGYVARLTDDVAQRRNGRQVSHIVDFGSGQNYLGRTLASPLFNKRIIAIERKHDLVQGANLMDERAKLVVKKVPRLVNKKEYRSKRKETVNDPKYEQLTNSPRNSRSASALPKIQRGSVKEVPKEPVTSLTEDVENIDPILNELRLNKDDFDFSQFQKQGTLSEIKEPCLTGGGMDYIEHEIKDGYLEPIIQHVVKTPSPTSAEENMKGDNEQDMKKAAGSKTKPQVMVISLHSCGNLVHHGVRSLALNPSVVAIAMIGCCYNLMTERLGPPTFKIPLPSFRSAHPRLQRQSDAYDPHGFPMSKTLENYVHPTGHGATEPNSTDNPIVGIRFNITARMMAVQAPYNWGPDDSEGFFTRHFYRALLQRILRDREVVPQPRSHSFTTESSPSSSSSSSSLSPSPSSSRTDSKNLDNHTNGPSGGTPLIVGSLRKSAFVSFHAYARAAINRLSRDPVHGATIIEKVGTEGLLTTRQLEWYAEHYAPSKKRLSIMWSLMAFSAAVVEAIIVVDRWLFLREQHCVEECWVEPVFDYAASPRNLAVVGIKKA